VFLLFPLYKKSAALAMGQCHSCRMIHRSTNALTPTPTLMLMGTVDL
jgi:hypothetical protein